MKVMDIEEILLVELKKAKISRYRIAQYVGMDETALCRFVKGERGLSIKNANKLLMFFGYSWAKMQKMPKLPPPVKRGRPRKTESNADNGQTSHISGVQPSRKRGKR